MARPRHLSNLPRPSLRSETHQTSGQAAELSQGASCLIEILIFNFCK
jgi:hypothetical protein